MLGIFRKLEKTGGELIVTDHGRPVLKIVPIEPQRPAVNELFAPYRGRVIYREDIMTPLTGEWGTLRDDLP